MDAYHKIQTVYLRDPETKHKTLLEGQYALPEFGYLADNKWVFTEKIDGTNIRVDWNGGTVTLGGRTDAAQIPAFLVEKLQDLFLRKDPFSQYAATPMTLYGEGYGAKIQKGGGDYIPDGCDFILFDIQINGNYLDRVNVEDIASCLGVKVVPIVGTGTMQDAVEMCRAGFPSLVGTQTAEGIVLRPEVELRTRTGHRVISKIKHKDFGG